ncbi:unnamed protein product [Blepharisma stoltei]|uniref:Dynactin subunit 2 n=1 Tax=Blepharisma stoltei TaxID=1481888 RepID=A0AAU9JCM0_9CILI|nr:unnamed protein product [Blepharisma stoltei]
MEGKAQVLETPDFQKTIEEINEEIEPKVFSQSLGIESKPRDKSMTEIFDYFNSLGRKQARYDYLKERKEISNRNDRVNMLEKELKSIREELESQRKDINENAELLNEVLELGEMIENVKAKMETASHVQIQNSKINFKPNREKKETNDGEKLTGGFLFEMQLNDSEEKSRIARLDNKIRELEFIVGNWKQSKPANESLAEFISKTRFINSELLEKLTDQARHLGTDLDIMLSSRTEVQASPESIEAIKNLHRDTFQHLSEVSKLPQIIEKIKFSSPIYAAHLQLDSQLLDLETSTDALLSEISQSGSIIEELRAGIEANRGSISNNVAILNQKIK